MDQSLVARSDAQGEHRAFISYRRQNASGVARWLRNRLVRYMPPKALLEVLVAEKHQAFTENHSYYLDTAYAKANEDFWDSNIEPALQKSKYLIVISSQTAFERRPDGTENWVAREIERFHAIHGDSRRIKLALGPGAPENLFPGRLAALSARWDWADFRGYTFALWRWLNLPRALKLDDEFLKIVAAIFDVPSDLLPVLRQEETRRRLRIVRLAIAILVVTVTAFAGLAGWAEVNRREAVVQRRMADEQRKLAEEQRSIAETRRAAVLAGAADAESPRGNQGTAMRFGVYVARLAHHLKLNELATSSADAVLAGIVWKSELRLTLGAHESEVRSAVFSPDGSRVVTASNDGTARIWNTISGNEITVLRGHKDSVLSAAFSPDGSRIVTAAWDSTARIWDAQDGKALAILYHKPEYKVASARFSPDGSRIVTASNFTGTVRRGGEKTEVTIGLATIWDAASGNKIAVLEENNRVVWSADFSPDGSRIVITLSDGTARFWDVASGNETPVILGDVGRILSAAFSPDGSRIVITVNDGTTRFWDVAGGKNNKVGVLRGHENEVNSAVFSPDGSRIVTASGDGTARIWDAQDGKEVLILRTRGARSVAFSPDGSRIVTASGDGIARIWDAASGKGIAHLRNEQRLPVFIVDPNSLNSAAFSPDGSRVVTASNDGTARIWNVSFATMSNDKLIAEVCLRRLRGFTTLSLDEMQLVGYTETTPEIDVCAALE
jgi:WD40 repeat protein